MARACTTRNRKILNMRWRLITGYARTLKRCPRAGAGVFSFQAIARSLLRLHAVITRFDAVYSRFWPERQTGSVNGDDRDIRNATILHFIASIYSWKPFELHAITLFWCRWEIDFLFSFEYASPYESSRARQQSRQHSYYVMHERRVLG